MLTHSMKLARLPLISGGLRGCCPRMTSPVVPFRLTCREGVGEVGMDHGKSFHFGDYKCSAHPIISIINSMTHADTCYDERGCVKPGFYITSGIYYVCDPHLRS